MAGKRKPSKPLNREKRKRVEVDDEDQGLTGRSLDSIEPSEFPSQSPETWMDTFCIVRMVNSFHNALFPEFGTAKGRLYLPTISNNWPLTVDRFVECLENPREDPLLLELVGWCLRGMMYRSDAVIRAHLDMQQRCEQALHSVTAGSDDDDSVSDASSSADYDPDVLKKCITALSNTLEYEVTEEKDRKTAEDARLSSLAESVGMIEENDTLPLPDLIQILWSEKWKEKQYSLHDYLQEEDWHFLHYQSIAKHREEIRQYALTSGLAPELIAAISDSEIDDETADFDPRIVYHFTKQMLLGSDDPDDEEEEFFLPAKLYVPVNPFRGPLLSPQISGAKAGSEANGDAADAGGEHTPASNPFQNVNFWDFDARTLVICVRLLLEWRLEEYPDIDGEDLPDSEMGYMDLISGYHHYTQEVLQLIEGDAERFRLESLGEDSSNAVYWRIDYSPSVWKEAAAKESRVPEKLLRGPTSKKKVAETKWQLVADFLDAYAGVVESNGKRWTKPASSLSELRSLAKQLKRKRKGSSEEVLHESIEVVIEAVEEEMDEAAERRRLVEQQEQKEIKMQELIANRKRSSRIAANLAQAEAERLRQEEEERLRKLEELRASRNRRLLEDLPFALQTIYHIVQRRRQAALSALEPTFLPPVAVKVDPSPVKEPTGKTIRAVVSAESMSVESEEEEDPAPTLPDPRTSWDGKWRSLMNRYVQVFYSDSMQYYRGLVYDYNTKEKAFTIVWDDQTVTVMPLLKKQCTLNESCVDRWYMESSSDEMEEYMLSGMSDRRREETLLKRAERKRQVDRLLRFLKRNPDDESIRGQIDELLAMLPWYTVELPPRTTNNFDTDLPQAVPTEPATESPTVSGEHTNSTESGESSVANVTTTQAEGVALPEAAKQVTPRAELENGVTPESQERVPEVAAQTSEAVDGAKEAVPEQRELVTIPEPVADAPVGVPPAVGEGAAVSEPLGCGVAEVPAASHNGNAGMPVVVGSTPVSAPAEPEEKPAQQKVSIGLTSAAVLADSGMRGTTATANVHHDAPSAVAPGSTSEPGSCLKPNDAQQ